MEKNGGSHVPGRGDEPMTALDVVRRVTEIPVAINIDVGE